MTLRELFAKTPFDSIVPYIKRSKQPNDVSQYKQAYDILLHTTPNENGCRDVYVEIKRNPDGTQWVYANELEGCMLNRFIDGSIIFDDGEEVCNEQLAFCLLWEITFYGYTPEQCSETFRMHGNDGYHDNEYGRMARQIDDKRTILWANKEIRKRIAASIAELEAEGRHSIMLSVDDWDYIEHNECHCNRLKRMRDHRLEQRLKKLANLDRCENTIQRLLRAQTTAITRDDLDFLWDENGRIGTEFRSRAYDSAKRLEYLEELITKYGVLDVAKSISKGVARIATSTDFPLTSNERSRLYNLITESTNDNSPIMIEATDNSVGLEIEIMIVGIEKT